MNCTPINHTYSFEQGSEEGLKTHKYKEHASHERALCPEEGCGKLIKPERLQWHLSNIHNWGR